MAEPTLTLTYTDLAAETARFIGMDDDSSNWSATEAARLKKYVNAAYRQTLTPPPVPPNQVPHRWSFLRPTADFRIWTTVDSVVMTGTTTVTAASSVFYASMVGKTLVADTSSTEYTITGYTSATVVTVDSTIAADSGDTFTLTANGSYRLPDDFGGLVDCPTYDTSTWSPQPQGLSITNPHRIRSLRQGYNSSTGRPWMCAVEPISTSDTGTSGQRWDFLVYPFTDQGYTLSIPYRRKVDELDTTNVYPVGAADIGEVLLQACRAVADRRENDNQGHEHAEWLRLLAIAVRSDQDNYAAKTLGHGRYDRGEGHMYWRTNSVTYNGSVWNVT